jgi:hypothetical protein
VLKTGWTGKKPDPGTDWLNVDIVYIASKLDGCVFPGKNFPARFIT